MNKKSQHGLGKGADFIMVGVREKLNLPFKEYVFSGRDGGAVTDTRLGCFWQD